MEQALMELLFNTPEEPHTAEWERLQRIDLHNLTSYELECLQDEISSVLQTRRQEASDEV